MRIRRVEEVTEATKATARGFRRSLFCLFCLFGPLPGGIVWADGALLETDLQPYEQVQELRLAAVDWDDDGDLDCIAGTADGKLMLFRDPKVGRPTNLKALAGVDNILLAWAPNQQSRIRGYRVYRKETQATEGTQGTTTDNPLAGCVALVPGVALVSSSLTTQLPTYRDFPPTTDEYAYKVSLASLLADMDISPAFGAVDETGTLVLTYTMPKLEITAFDSQTGAVRFKATPGEGNQTVSEIVTGQVLKPSAAGGAWRSPRPRCGSRRRVLRTRPGCAA